MTICSPWATAADIADCDASIDIYADAEELERFLLVSSDLLYQLSGQQFPGECSDTLRPCSRRCGPELWTRPSYRWGQTAGLPWPGCSCDGSSSQWCSCKHIHQVDLGIYPLIEFTEVLVDGAVVPPR